MPITKDSQRIEYVFNVEAFMSDVRLKSGVKTLNEIEALTGINKSILSRWENSVNLPALDTFMSICAKLQLEPCAYFDKQIWELKKCDS